MAPQIPEEHPSALGALGPRGRQRAPHGHRGRPPPLRTWAPRPAGGGPEVEKRACTGVTGPPPRHPPHPLREGEQEKGGGHETTLCLRLLRPTGPGMLNLKSLRLFTRLNNNNKQIIPKAGLQVAHKLILKVKLPAPFFKKNQTNQLRWPRASRTSTALASLLAPTPPSAQLPCRGPARDHRALRSPASWARAAELLTLRPSQLSGRTRQRQLFQAAAGQESPADLRETGILTAQVRGEPASLQFSHAPR